MAQTDVTTITQDELSQILSGNVDSIITPKDDDKVEPDNKDQDKNPAFKKPINVDFTWKELQDVDKDKDDIKDPEEPIVPQDNNTDPEKKPGRKASDLVTMVNELVESKDLFGFEEGPVKTIEDAKELIKLNIEQSKNSTVEELWEQKLQKYSPQIQAILHYAEQGGTDVTPLISAISEVERTSNFDVESEEGQESIIGEYLRMTGWSEDDIKDELETTKDIGKLKVKAEKFLPKLNQMNEQRMENIMQEQAVRQQKAEEARRNYLSTIKDTLDKDKLGDVKLLNKEKALIWDGLTDIKYTSWSGQPTNLFFKKLEEMQAGDKADYDHFLEIVYLTLNRKSFKDKLREELKTLEAASTVKKLKIEESRKTSTNEGFEEEPRKNVIKRQAFKNPWG